MQPPDEMMTQTFLPAMRQLVARKLHAQGLPQSRVSAILGVTQASVSLYLSSAPDRAYSALSKFAISRKDAEVKAALLADALRADPAEGVRALFSIWTGLLGSGSACAYHRELYPSLADCDICITEFGKRGGARPDLISEVSSAVRMLEASPEFVPVMPEVSVNIACAAEDASSPADVVAIPGRIVRVRDRAKAMLPPEAGASAHMARILLLARSRQKDLRACINIRFDERMATAMRKSGLRSFSIGRHSRRDVEDPTAKAVQSRIGSLRGPFDAIIDEGGSGIEPNVYLFARSAKEAVELALRLARAYSAA
jgi:predicted fused transcriptional regulator/phosphomethylpyrimidine kinase/predicted transcriptional regulator